MNTSNPKVGQCRQPMRVRAQFRRNVLVTAHERQERLIFPLKPLISLEKNRLLFLLPLTRYSALFNKSGNRGCET